MEALDMALVNVYSLLIVATLLIQFGSNAPCTFLGIGPLRTLGEQVSVEGRRYGTVGWGVSKFL